MRRYLLLGLLLVTGCKEDPVGPELGCDDALPAYASVSGDTVVVQEAVRYIQLQPGSGDVSAQGDLVQVLYQLYTTPETNAFCTVQRASFSFTIGVGQVIPGFELGVRGMKEGGSRRVILAPSAGYTDSTHPLFGKVLIFDVEVLAIT